MIANKLIFSKAVCLAVVSISPFCLSSCSQNEVATPPKPAHPAVGLASRIFVTEPLMGHPPVSEASRTAIAQAVESLPSQMRKKLDASQARITISPNLIDRWPDAIKNNDLPEDTPALNLAELPGRIYGQDMNIYERPKLRKTTELGAARPPQFIKLQALNMCFQVFDDMETISKSPQLRAAHDRDKMALPPEVRDKLWTFCKQDDWGPRETCAETFAALLGGKDQYSDDLMRYFPNTRDYLEQRLSISPVGHSQNQTQ
ncbi:MAG: hypothetical protein K2X70_10600 [Candidatus Obscuribacterales bacterium]|nr:hypothetical protein [Candidatus Obscuribacterales bacterium]